MARVEWAESAVSAHDRLILTHSLPADTHNRVVASLRPLARFPRIGPEISRLEDGQELRFAIRPWPWLVIVYLYDGATDRVVIGSPEDGRSATSTVTRRRPKPR